MRGALQNPLGDDEMNDSNLLVGDERLHLTEQGQVTLECIERARFYGMEVGDFMTKAEAIADQCNMTLAHLLRITR